MDRKHQLSSLGLVHNFIHDYQRNYPNTYQHFIQKITP